MEQNLTVYNSRTRGQWELMNLTKANIMIFSGFYETSQVLLESATDNVPSTMQVLRVVREPSEDPDVLFPPVSLPLIDKNNWALRKTEKLAVICFETYVAFIWPYLVVQTHCDIF